LAISTAFKANPPQSPLQKGGIEGDLLLTTEQQSSQPKGFILKAINGVIAEEYGGTLACACDCVEDCFFV
jgi:hypothetical protein